VSYPCAYRVVTLQDATLHIQTLRITDIDSDTGGVPFQEYAENFLRARMQNIVVAELMGIFQLPQTVAEQLAPLVSDALVANYAGDEDIPPETEAMLHGFVQQGGMMETLGYLLLGIWTDLPPADNELTIQLLPDI
jgi:hypothetical protein